jgi:Big-like domain-containing protein
MAPLAGCGKRGAPIVLPSTPPPQISAVFPAALATGVLYDTSPLWAAFTQPLDSTTVNDHTVFLKIDDLRVRCSARWDGAGRRVLVVPAGPLRLRTTYTVVLSQNLRTAAGAALPGGYAWQFTTNSVKRLTPALPVADASHASLVTPLAWSGNDSTLDPVRYEVWTGTDSAIVAARAPGAAFTTTLPFLLARIAWPAAAPVWWTVRTTNLATGEVIDNPLWRFITLDPASAPVDSVHATPSYWGFTTTVVSCQGGVVSTGGATAIAVIEWPVTGITDTTARIDAARMDLFYDRRFLPAIAVCTVWPSITHLGPAGRWPRPTRWRVDGAGSRPRGSRPSSRAWSGCRRASMGFCSARSSRCRT